MTSEQLSSPKPVDRIRLISMGDDPDPVPVGTTGTIVPVYPHGDWMQVDVDRDNGRTLMLSVPPDRCELMQQPKGCCGLAPD